MNNSRIETVKPTFEVSVGAAFFCVIKNRTPTDIVYQNKIIRSDVIRELGLTPTVAEQEIWASGTLFEYVSQVTGGNISLNAVALDKNLLTELSGATQTDGFVFNRATDLEKEFAFGYWGENRDGTMVFYWHPVCKLVPGEDNKTSRTNDPSDPQKNYNIKIIPFGSGAESGLWRVMYDQGKDIAAGNTPLSIEEFFGNVIYKEDQI